MELSLLNAVILAEDYPKVRDWWIRALDLELKQEWTERYHYAELVRGGRFVVGIASAAEMKAKPTTPRTNAVVPQLQVDDVARLLERVRTEGGAVVFGPSFDEVERFTYGAFEDVEGNQVWVVSLPERLR